MSSGMFFGLVMPEVGGASVAAPAMIGGKSQSWAMEPATDKITKKYWDKFAAEYETKHKMSFMNSAATTKPNDWDEEGLPSGMWTIKLIYKNNGEKHVFSIEPASPAVVALEAAEKTAKEAEKARKVTEKAAKKASKK
jgi:hypothetical protein